MENPVSGSRIEPMVTQTVDITKWTVHDLTLEDLEKLPQGPRELMLLNLPIAELLRLCESQEIAESIGLSLNSPGFWVKRMQKDGFLLADDILVFAEKWRKKNQTAAQFLRSFYYGYKLDRFNLGKMADCLRIELPKFEKFNPRQEVVAKIKELSALIEAEKAEALKLDHTLTALMLSTTVYLQRYPRSHIVNFRLPSSLVDLPTSTSLLKDFLAQLDELPLAIEQPDFIPDPADIILDAYYRSINIGESIPTKAERKQIKLAMRTQFYQTPELASQATRRTSIGPCRHQLEQENTQTPGYEAVKEKYQRYFQLITQLAREGDIILNSAHRFYIYSQEDQLHVKSYFQALPEEALPFLQREKLSTVDQIHQRYLVDAIEVQGHLVHLGDDRLCVLRVGDHTLCVSLGGTVGYIHPRETRCRWLTVISENKYRRCVRRITQGHGLKLSNYFCVEHEQSETDEKEQQVERCQIEDCEEISLDQFPLLNDQGELGDTAVITAPVCQPRRVQPVQRTPSRPFIRTRSARKGL
jgi:hypothetical protein